MPVKWLLTLLLSLPVMLYAMQEEDMELFEFLAMYELGDNVFIDSEIDEGIETAKANTEDELINQEVIKSESDEQ
ncbi:MAG: hypothetical protein OEY78_09180 [Gammaproteobacteria bacterium]|nr:hypothetical protein [Gammaproteobacteria bacterium]